MFRDRVVSLESSMRPAVYWYTTLYRNINTVCTSIFTPNRPCISGQGGTRYHRSDRQYKDLLASDINIKRSLYSRPEVLTLLELNPRLSDKQLEIRVKQMLLHSAAVRKGSHLVQMICMICSHYSS